VSPLMTVCGGLKVQRSEVQGSRVLVRDFGRCVNWSSGQIVKMDGIC
jgi:hypothetical protein